MEVVVVEKAEFRWTIKNSTPRPTVSPFESQFRFTQLLPKKTGCQLDQLTIAAKKSISKTAKLC